MHPDIRRIDRLQIEMDFVRTRLQCLGIDPDMGRQVDRAARFPDDRGFGRPGPVCA